MGNRGTKRDAIQIMYLILKDIKAELDKGKRPTLTVVEGLEEIVLGYDDLPE